MKLVIVESPTKAKTISKFIGSDYSVESSFGHVRDLPKSTMGVDIENGFVPKYVISAKAKQTITKLKSLSKEADEIILATDEDREGEAIAWHLSEALSLPKAKGKTVSRIVFHEITKSAIMDALDKPRQLDTQLVDAQQARRVLDRLVGYELSPFLWRKVVKGLSAGRVQSVAVRLIVEREREIQAFVAQEYWTVDAWLKHESQIGADEHIIARLNKIGGKTLDKFHFGTKEETQAMLDKLKGAEYIISHTEKKESKKKSPAPFMTSTLQQVANRWLGMSAKQIMRVAQQLYEGVPIKGEGQVGLITYMRTDSLNLSDSFLTDARRYLREKLGDKYALPEPRRFKTKSKGAQEAHEAIRPTSAFRDPESLKNSLDPSQYKLYKLIWQRAMASQMPEAAVDSTVIDVNAEGTDCQFRATGQTIKFKGYLEIYPEKSKELILPKVEIGEKLDLTKLADEQHFTKPPARYSDAGLVKVMEEYGIGRPSTYAPTIATIEARNYVQRDEQKRLMPTDIAFVVIDLLIAHFTQIVDFKFTADMEEDLDKIAEGARQWQTVIGDFYGPFHNNLKIKDKELKKENIMPEEATEEVCDKCGAPMVVKTGRFGKFLSCSAFPDCKNAKPMGEGGDSGVKDEKYEELAKKYKDEKCEKCAEPMTVKKGRFGYFLGCSNYPKCKTIKSLKENDPAAATGITCPTCGQGEIIMKRSRRGPFYACNRYPDCKTSFSGKPLDEKCPDCNGLLVATAKGAKCTNKECGFKK